MNSGDARSLMKTKQAIFFFFSKKSPLWMQILCNPLAAKLRQLGHRPQKILAPIQAMK